MAVTTAHTRPVSRSAWTDVTEESRQVFRNLEAVDRAVPRRTSSLPPQRPPGTGGAHLLEIVREFRVPGFCDRATKPGPQPGTRRARGAHVGRLPSAPADTSPCRAAPAGPGVSGLVPGFSGDRGHSAAEVIPRFRCLGRRWPRCPRWLRFREVGGPPSARAAAAMPDRCTVPCTNGTEARQESEARGPGGQSRVQRRWRLRCPRWVRREALADGG